MIVGLMLLSCIRAIILACLCNFHQQKKVHSVTEEVHVHVHVCMYPTIIAPSNLPCPVYTLAQTKPPLRVHVYIP
jgi:hypothetical protein